MLIIIQNCMKFKFVSKNKVLLEHSLAHFASTIAVAGTIWSTRPKILYGPF